jgi:hypothetical protein
MSPKESQPAETSFSVDITWPRPLRLARYVMVLTLFAFMAAIVGNVVVPRSNDPLSNSLIGLVVMVLAAFALCLITIVVELTLRWRRLARKDIIPG